jgi:hypothetical protein
MQAYFSAKSETQAAPSGEHGHEIHLEGLASPVIAEEDGVTPPMDRVSVEKFLDVIARHLRRNVIQPMGSVKSRNAQDDKESRRDDECVFGCVEPARKADGFGRQPAHPRGPIAKIARKGEEPDGDR